MDSQTILMVYDKATKNKHVYRDEGGGPPVISSLYVEKYVLGTNPPSRIKVTVEDA